MSDVVIAGRGHCCDPFSALKEEIDMAVTIAMNARNIAERALESSVKAMIYKGTVGTGGTIESLPVADETNIGWTYLAITAGTTPDDTPKSYEIGDMIISNGEEWTVVPAGDDPVLWSDIQNKPTTLSGYGITDAVNTTGDQTGIAGAKTWTGEQTIVNNWLIAKRTDVDFTQAPSSNIYINGIDFQDMNNQETGAMFHYYETNGNASSWLSSRSKVSGSITDARIGVYVGSTGTKWATAPVRTYNSANTDDIVTIGSLASNPNVVHTTGNESIAGNKEWSGTQTLLYQGPDVKTTLDVTSMNAFAQRSLMVGYDTNNKAISGYAVSTATSENTTKLTLSRYNTLGTVLTTARLILVATDSGAQLRLEKTTGGVTTSTTVATI